MVTLVCTSLRALTAQDGPLCRNLWVLIINGVILVIVYLITVSWLRVDIRGAS